MIRHVVLLLAAFMFCQAQPVFSQSTEELKSLQQDVKSLKEGQAAMQKDLQEIKKLLQAKPTVQVQPQPAEFKETIISVDGAPSRGSKNAKLALVEFSDYQ